MWGMRSALTSTMIACLLAPALPVTAQEQTIAAASGPRAPGPALGAVRGAVEGEASRVRNDDRAALPASHSDAYWYGRFGYGTIAGEQRFGGLSIGFGRRIERNALGIDVLFFSGQAKLFGTAPDLHQVRGVYTHAYSASVMTVRGLYFVRPRSRATAYVGAGTGWRAVSFGRSVDVDEQWHGKGLEGGFIVGYALARAATSTRFFVEADMTRPFYRAKRYSNREVVVGDRYAPSLVVSIGVGW